MYVQVHDMLQDAQENRGAVKETESYKKETEGQVEREKVKAALYIHCEKRVANVSVHRGGY